MKDLNLRPTAAPGAELELVAVFHAGHRVPVDL